VRGGLWELSDPSAGGSQSKKLTLRLSRLESRAVEGDSPVDVMRELWRDFPSNTALLECRVNLAGPPVKPKYSLMTDSGQVP
jgi:hypothetical protein